MWLKTTFYICKKSEISVIIAYIKIYSRILNENTLKLNDFYVVIPME